MTKDEALIARLREEATYDLNHETIALLIEAAEALAQPEQEPLFKKIIDKHPGLAEELKAMDDPEQEPRGWQWFDTSVFRKKLPDMAEPGAWHPLYTTPPQRKPLQFAGLSITEIRLPIGMTLRFENEALIIEAAHHHRRTHEQRTIEAGA